MTGFKFRPAVRGETWIMLGIAGPSRSGKTYSALRIAMGMTGGDPSKIAVIDTEARRALLYADRFGKFMHCDLTAPFTSDRYKQAILDAQKSGATVVIVDSQSHEHEGPGGLLEQHEDFLNKKAGEDYAKRDRLKFTAWIKPKAEHNKFVNTVLQVNMHMIFCFRAKEKLKLVPDDKGKVVPTPIGWQPICSDRFEYEMTGMLVLPPGAKGVPDLAAGATELREPLDTMIRPNEQLSEGLGKRLIEWATGTVQPTPAPSPSNGSAYDPLEAARAAARQGTEAFRTWWNGEGKTVERREAVKPHLDELKKIAAAADAADVPEEDPFSGSDGPGEPATPAGGNGEPAGPYEFADRNGELTACQAHVFADLLEREMRACKSPSVLEKLWGANQVAVEALVSDEDAANGAEWADQLARTYAERKELITPKAKAETAEASA